VVRSDEINANRPPYSSSVAIYKPEIITDKESRDLKAAKNTATLKLGLAASKAFVVKGTVDGFTSSTHRVYTVDTVAHVVVAAAGVDQRMWVLSRTFTQSADGGQLTELEFIGLGALVLGEVPGGS
jgi:prophage tail gpP-like protein